MALLFKEGSCCSSLRSSWVCPIPCYCLFFTVQIVQLSCTCARGRPLWSRHPTTGGCIATSGWRGQCTNNRTWTAKCISQGKDCIWRGWSHLLCSPSTPEGPWQCLVSTLLYLSSQMMHTSGLDYKHLLSHTKTHHWQVLSSCFCKLPVHHNQPSALLPTALALILTT